MQTRRFAGAGYRWSVRVLFCLCMMMTTGCGSGLDDLTASRTLIVSECGGHSDLNAELVAIDWDGGFNALSPDTSLAGLDLALFETFDGGTLADSTDAFKEAVRMEVTRIYCDSDTTPIRVVHAEDATQPADTIVHITQAQSQRNEMQVGEGEYDPCNQQNDNTAVVYGEQIRQLTRTATFDEWVTIFANVAAHEIGHTLGYGHIDRSEFASADENQTVELMLDGHTVAQLRSTQRIMVEQDICPH